MKHYAMYAGSVAAAALVATPVNAQAAPTAKNSFDQAGNPSATASTTDARPQSSAPAPEGPTLDDGTNAEQGGALRDIIVTAQRRQDSIQRVPVAVSAFDQQTLASPVINDLRDLAGRAPGLVIDSVSSTPGGAAISIRGVSFGDIEKSFDPTVGVVVDGVFIGTNTNQLLDSFDLKRIEVLRGPQGTLFGRNTIGGVISVTRTDPTSEAGARGSIAYSNYDTKRGRLVVNTGQITDWLAVKGFGFWDKTDGFYRNVTKGRREGRYETLSGGATALITPSSSIRGLFTYEHQRVRGEAVAVPTSVSSEVICLAPGRPGFSPARECNRNSTTDVYTSFTPQATPVRSDVDAITANIDVTLGAFTVTSVTGYRTSEESVTQDFDASTATFYDTVRPQNYEQFSQELRIAGDITDSINLLVGAYYFDSNYQFPGITNLGPVLAGGASLQLRQYVDSHSKSYAGFADARWKLTDRFSIGGGIRYTEDRKRMFNNFGRAPSLVAITLPTYDGRECVQVSGAVTLAPGVVLPAYSRATNCTGSANFGKVTWRANANYQIDPSKLTYVSYSKGFRSGGFNGRATSPTSLGPYQPETVDAYEAGLKADWLNRTLRTNVAAYYSRYNNKQEEIVQTAPAGSSAPQETVVRNVSTATIKGFEIEAIAQPVRDVSFNVTASYIDAKFNRFFNDINGDNVPDDVSDLKLRRAPKWQWSIGANYSHDLGRGRVEAGSTLRFISDYTTCITPARPAVPGAIRTDPRCFTGDNENLDAQLGYALDLASGRRVKLSLFGRNLTDNRGIATTLPVAGLFSFSTARTPRTYGIELSFDM